MKRTICAFILGLVLAGTAFSQQMLWTDSKEFAVEGTSYTPNVKVELAKLYAQYKYYYDDSGYSREDFEKSYGGTWKWIKDIRYPVVIAVIIPTNGFAFVYVFFVDQYHGSIIKLSDYYEAGAIDASVKNLLKFNTLVDSVLK